MHVESCVTASAAISRACRWSVACVPCTAHASRCWELPHVALVPSQQVQARCWSWGVASVIGNFPIGMMGAILPQLKNGGSNFPATNIGSRTGEAAKPPALVERLRRRKTVGLPLHADIGLRVRRLLYSIMPSMSIEKPTTNVLLRDIDQKLWRLAKSRAAKEGITLKTLISKLLASYVKDGLTR